jgi:hypothetical protein
MEKWVLEVLKGTLDEHEFYEFLTLPYIKGGLGLGEEQSKMMVRRVFDLLFHSRDVQRFREIRSADGRFIQQQKYLDRLLEYLKEEIGIVPTGQQYAVLKEAVGDRVGGIINVQEFEELVVLPFEQGGAAFKEREGYLIARYVEKLIAQGAYIIRPNELAGAHS